VTPVAAWPPVGGRAAGGGGTTHPRPGRRGLRRV